MRKGRRVQEKAKMNIGGNSLSNDQKKKRIILYLLLLLGIFFLILKIYLFIL